MRCAKSPCRTRSVPMKSSWIELVIDRASASPMTRATSSMMRNRTRATTSINLNAARPTCLDLRATARRQALVQLARPEAQRHRSRARRLSGRPSRSSRRSSRSCRRARTSTPCRPDWPSSARPRLRRVLVPATVRRRRRLHAASRSYRLHRSSCRRSGDRRSTQPTSKRHACRRAAARGSRARARPARPPAARPHDQSREAIGLRRIHSGAARLGSAGAARRCSHASARDGAARVAGGAPE